MYSVQLIKYVSISISNMSAIADATMNKIKVLYARISQFSLGEVTRMINTSIKMWGVDKDCNEKGK